MIFPCSSMLTKPSKPRNLIHAIACPSVSKLGGDPFFVAIVHGYHSFPGPNAWRNTELNKKLASQVLSVRENEEI